ncbi:sterol desaturase family protein [Candidatus Palauibacter sp.]|uniref:sterol desaturase family protein n=1 Tax=Candidatus Palauibacter sp. TaxID=3101350 RepID=UPI003B5B1BC7
MFTAVFDDPVTLKTAGATLALATLWLVEGVLPMFEGRSARARHGARNLALGVGNAAVTALIFAAATLLVTEGARERGFGLLHALGLPGWARIALAVVIFDAWQYLWHRLNHRVPFLWRFHQVHHSDAELDATSGLRFHTGEIVLSSVARLAVLPILGLTVAEVLVYETILLPIILFHHSNLRVPGAVDRRLRWLIVTPWMHWVHHSDHQPETDSNYSSIFSFWDRAFRSFRLRAEPRDIRLGLENLDRSEWGTLRGMLAMPFRRRRGRTSAPTDPDRMP